jgi:hypothetical protein
MILAMADVDLGTAEVADEVAVVVDLRGSPMRADWVTSDRVGIRYLMRLFVICDHPF